jgi:hypothetical protein
MDWQHIAYPYLDQDISVIDAVIHRSRAAGVDTVMVEGEVILKEGKFTKIDKEAALAELAASLSVPRTPEEARRRELSQQIFPHVKQFYDGWLDQCDCHSFYCQSSRH